MAQMLQRIAEVLGVATVALALSSCTLGIDKAAEKPQATSAPTAERQEKKPASPAMQRPQQGAYEIVPATSTVRILVYRTGRLAKQGHNHVISSPDVQGSLVLTRDRIGSKVDIRVPVATLVVDDPEQRKEAGKDFDTSPSEQQIESIRRTMLSSRVLDAGPYPLITVKATVVGGSTPNFLADTQIDLHGKTQRFQTPVKFEPQGVLATASGEFTIRQKDFDIEPISLLGGALAVKDEVKIRFRIVARPKQR